VRPSGTRSSRRVAPQPCLARPRRAPCARLAAGALAALLTLALAACGSAKATAPRSAAVTATALTVASSSTPTAASAVCASAVAGTLGDVGKRIYREAASGGDVAQAVHRVQSSSALASAIAAGNTSAARQALNGLLLGQIVRVEVLRGGRTFASAGQGSALAPVRGSLPGASFVLSVQSVESYLKVAQQVTGSQVLLITSSGRRLAGTFPGPAPASLPQEGTLRSSGQSYQVASLNGAAYPSGALRIALLVPSRAISCPASIPQARVETLGHVGERIYQEELHSPTVSATVRQMEQSPSFIQAVGARNVASTQAAIVGFFRAHIHVVRVRVTVGERLLTDVGGPYALAPVQGTLRSGGRVVGHFTTAIQDDAGYLKLAHLFTGADVLMRTGERQVMGTLSPGPASVPDRGDVAYGGHSYQAFSFTGEAFPSGPLRISLLVEA
jgi:hypothetical protein